MAKAIIYKDIFDTKTLVVKEFITHGEKPYTLNINKALSSPQLFDNITLQIENLIKTKSLVFNKICATSVSALPYATNVATSLEKPIAFIHNAGNNVEEKGDIKHLKVEGGMDIDDKILLIETVCSNDFYLENVISKIRKYGGVIVGVIVVLNICEGEYCNLIDAKENIMPLFNLFDIFTHLENNNMIEMFYSEKIKFHCEKENKINMRKLLV
jgi:orotate phosphoribosyltransferase